MSGSSSPDYKALFLKADEERKRAEERQRLVREREGQERRRNRHAWQLFTPLIALEDHGRPKI